MVEMRERMVDILVTAGQPREKIVADIDRDYTVRGRTPSPTACRPDHRTPPAHHADGDRRLNAATATSVEQVGMARDPLRRRQAEMRERRRHRHSAAGVRAISPAGSGTARRRPRPSRSAPPRRSPASRARPVRHGTADTTRRAQPGRLVEAEHVDAEHGEAALGGGGVDAADLGEVAHATQEPVGDPQGTAGAERSPSPGLVDAAEDVGGTHDDLQLFGS